MYKRILIATDDSALSKKAVVSGIKMAKALGAEVVAYTAVVRSYYENAGLLAPNEITRIDTAAHESAAIVVNELQDQALHQGLTATAIVGHEPIAEGIIAAAKKYKCDLIVMASHGRKGFKRLLVGSETLDVLTHSHIPVLVLR